MRRRSRARSSLLVATLLAITLAGCHFVRMRKERIETAFRAHGLSPAELAVADAQVHVWTGGEGPVVLLLHGFGASAIWQWIEQLPALAASYRLIVPDLLWFGGSSSELRDFSVDHQVRVVVALLDHLKAERAHVVGISYGGLVAYELACAHPERVDRLVLVDSPGRAYGASDHAALLERFGVADFGDVLVPKDADGVQTLLELGYYDPPWTTAGIREQTLEVLYADYREEKVALAAALVSDMAGLRTRPGRVVAQTLVLWGRHDTVFPVALGERVVGLIGAHATLRVIEEARHAPNIEQPERFNRLLVDFLASEAVVVPRAVVEP